MGNSGNLVPIYGMVAALSLLLMAGYLLWERQKERKLLLLFVFVAIVNCGYFLQSVASDLRQAMWANAVSYLGAAYSVLAMVLIIMDACRVTRKKWLTVMLTVITTAAFALAASGDWLGLYYRSVSLQEIDGLTILVKEYGPLHPLYAVYLLSYFGLMIGSVIQAARMKLASGKYGMFLIIAALLNLVVWAVEQIIDPDFEFLSVSYIITEIMLLLIHSMLRDYGIIMQGCGPMSLQTLEQFRANQTGEQPEIPMLSADIEEMLDVFSGRVATLSAAELRIFRYYAEGHEIADIPELAFISINTVKKHNRNIYQKLEVSSRDEMMLYFEFFRRCGRLDQLLEIGVAEAEPGVQALPVTCE